MPEDKNLVMGVTARLPVVISPIGGHGIRQPSQFTVVPVWVLREGSGWTLTQSVRPF